MSQIKAILELRLEQASEDANEAFWAEVARHYPEVTSGDLPPHDIFLFENIQKRMVASWLESNSNSPSEDLPLETA